MAHSRATLRLSLACDNRCIFCAQDGLHAPDLSHDDVVARLQSFRPRHDEVTFVGGEPTLWPGRADAVAAARAAGFGKIGVQTNGRQLPPLIDSLATAGLTDVHLSIHGADALVHDYTTGVEGSFASAFAAVAAARARGLTVAVTTVVHRSNFRVVGTMPWLLQARGVAAWLLSLPHAAGRAAGGFDRVVPRLGLAVPFALHALEAARKVGLPAWIGGAPLCLLGPYADRSLYTEERAYAPRCESCGARPQCPGLDATYLARFGGDELSIREAPTLLEKHVALARLFVGAGELAPPPAAVIPPPPAKVRAGLTVLGKVQPAVGEATAATPRRSGEALKEIFPDLFDKKPGGVA